MLIMSFKANGTIPETVENPWHSDTLRKLIKHHVSPTSATGFPSLLLGGLDPIKMTSRNFAFCFLTLVLLLDLSRAYRHTR